MFLGFNTVPYIWNIWIDINILDDCLRPHNIYRSRHVNTPRLQWDEDLAKTAQAYAEFMARKNFFEHSERYKHLGENLYYASNTGGISEDGMCKEAADAW